MLVTGLELHWQIRVVVSVVAAPYTRTVVLMNACLADLLPRPGLSLSRGAHSGVDDGHSTAFVLFWDFAGPDDYILCV